MLQGLDVPVADLPIVVIPGGPLLRNPGGRELLDALGMSGPSDPDLPACAIYWWWAGAGRPGRRGLRRVRGDGDGPGRGHRAGRPGGNVVPDRELLGFPAGLSGEELAARAALQAQKFGVRIKLAARAVSLSSDSGVHQVSFDDGDAIRRSRSSSPPERTTTGYRWTGSPSSRASACTTRPPRWRPRPAAPARSPSSAAATPPVRPPCSSAGAALKFTSSSGANAADLHVALPDRPDRAEPPHHRHAPNADHRAARERPAGRRGAAGYRPAGEYGTDRPGAVRFHRRTTQDRVAGGPARRRQPRVPAHRHQHPGGSARGQEPAAPVPGDQPARDLRRRRRPQWVGQAGSGRNRGRLDGGAAGVRPPPGHRECGADPPRTDRDARLATPKQPPDGTTS